MGAAFNGSTSIINLGDGSVVDNNVDSATVLSACLWIFPAADADMVILGKGAAATGWKWQDRESAGNHQLFFDFYSNRDADTPSGSLTKDAWNHAAFTYNGGAGSNATKLQMYIDAVAQVLGFTGTLPTTMPPNNLDLILGASITASPTWNGRMAYFKMWGAHLSAAEIKREMYSRRPLRTANLLFYIPMIGSDAVFKDFGPNKVALSLTAMALGHGPPA